MPSSSVKSAKSGVSSGKCKGCGKTAKAPSESDSAKSKTASASDPCCGFVRPRFFAGQLLSEQDLELLETYVIRKQRWHNRHFHDWGVVCGLEVTCDQGCHEGPSNSVTVHPGYALGPQGEDIVVCEAQTVDICALLCRDDPKNPCEKLVECDDESAGEEHWLLSIEYQEQPLPAPRGKRCGCGASPCGCGCKAGCGGDCGPACASRATCEGFAFRLSRADDDPKAEVWWKKGAYAVLAECLTEIFSALAGIHTPMTSADMVVLQNRLREIIASHPMLDCRLAKAIDAVVVPEQPTEGGPTVGQVIALYELIAILTGLMQECMCRSLLPPCPDFEPGAVPLATIRVRRGGCCVLSICDWGGRKFAHTLPNLYYYTAPLVDYVRDAIAQGCCFDLHEFFSQYGIYDAQGQVKPTETPPMAASSMTAKQAPAATYRIPRELDRQLTPELRKLVLSEVSRKAKGDPPPFAWQEMLSAAAPTIRAKLTERLAPARSPWQQLFNVVNSSAFDGVRAAVSPPSTDADDLKRTIQDLQARVRDLELGNAKRTGDE